MVTVKAIKQQNLFLPLEILKKLHLEDGEKIELDVKDTTIRFLKNQEEENNADKHIRYLLKKGFNLGVIGKVDRTTIYENID